jgi:hypothetical protein
MITSKLYQFTDFCCQDLKTIQKQVSIMSGSDSDCGGGIYMKQDSVISYCEPTLLTPPAVNSSKTLTENNFDQNISALQMKRNVSYGNMENTNEARVLVLYTGGTIGMIRNNKNGK